MHSMHHRIFTFITYTNFYQTFSRDNTEHSSNTHFNYAHSVFKKRRNTYGRNFDRNLYL